MSSPLLDLANTEGFRTKLIVRNLKPYAKAPNRLITLIDTVYTQSDSSVQDSPDKLIDEPSYANTLFPLNQYGNEGGYKQVPDPGSLLNKKSNEGEYGYQDANILGTSIEESKEWKPLNVFSNGSELLLDSAQFFDSLDRPLTTSRVNNQPYPTTFVYSNYSPLSILLSPDPIGNNGLLSQDSFIARLGAQTLRKEFEERIAAQIRQDTLGRANVLNISSGTDVVNILSGVVPIIEPVYTITVTSNPILAATNFALRLGGSILPVSPIPGSYFDPNVTLGQPTTIQQLGNAFRQSGVGKFFNRLMGGGDTGSQIMFNNMGAGQRSRLFKNIDLNRYKPNFPRNFFERVGGVLVGTVSDNSNFYVGNITSNPSKVFSPAGEVPVNQFGVEQQSPVYGPSELAQLYEGPDQSVRLGANGPTYGNGGGIEGGFTWVSPKYRGNAGKKVGVNGEIISTTETTTLASSYVDTESVRIPLKEGSILDNTQRLIDSQPQGGRRLQHVGNAIDQVSKVFNDGYKEMTKGSRVLSYVGDIGREVGTEYCRVFTKDVPYLQYNDLQKQDGITTEGRRFSYSVLDKTYNLNIVPNKQEGGQSSTNIVGPINTAVAKKYMFSLENLAWKTSNTPGFSTSDLAVCERGPNGGRVMWFPPYDLTFTESIAANWNPNDFLGRPEPIYTYKNSSRTGTISWKIVVDHPSVLNVIVNKVLSDEKNSTRINSILDSFFAGCRKYDIYDLAKEYVQINPNDLFELQQEINTKLLTREQLQFTRQTIQSGNDSPNGGGGIPISQSGGGGNTDELFNKYLNFGLYFDNDQPQGSTPINYTAEYNRYLSELNTTYKTKDTADVTTEFFNTVVTPNYEVIKGLAIELGKQLKTNPEGSVTILITSSCSAAATTTYNDELSQRRVNSMVQFFVESEFTKEFFGNRLFVKGAPLDRVSDVRSGPLGERTKSQPKVSKKTTGPFVSSEFGEGRIINCTDNDDNKTVGGDTQAGSKDIFTYEAMACRRAYISSVTSTLTAPQTTTTPQGVPPSNIPPQTVLVGNKILTTEPVDVISQEWKPKDNITKKVVRLLLSECDYFESIKETTPMVYDNLKDKLKYFHPVFHSMTPEGLNTRLTFLQQCMRPGDTIKTPFSQTVDASNTSFGAPPVLILRIGDFYNTKVIPTSLSLSYEGLDLNPEGIGVQPMIATVSMQFNFVGGSGLKESVDKLQNALTFNYYANTEIYDDRADATDIDSSLVLDQIFLQGQSPPPIPGVNSAVPNNGQDNNSTIGNIVSSTVDVNGVTTGIISYGEFMNKVVAETQTYFTDVVNKTKETVSQYNNAVRQQWLLERNYTQGNLNIEEGKVILFGKSNNVEKRFDQIFAELNKNIKDGTEGFIQYLAEDSKNLPASVIRVIQQNYGNFVSRKRSSFENGISTITQSLVNQQQIYIRDLARLNTITLDAQTGTDGFQLKNGPVIIYITSGTNEVPPNSSSSNTYQVLREDINTIKEDISKFNQVINTEKTFSLPGNNTVYTGILVFETQNGKSNAVSVEEVFLPFSKNPLFSKNDVNYPFRRVYMTISDEIIDGQKYESFKQQLIGNVIGNQAVLKGSPVDIDALFNAYWIDIARPVFLEENNITKFFIEDLEKNELKDYLIYTPPFDDKNQRNFTFTSINPANETEKKSQENMIKGLANTTNQNTNVLTWNDSLGEVEAYISKAKFN